jgi:hypothetical protein
VTESVEEDESLVDGERHGQAAKKRRQYAVKKIDKGKSLKTAGQSLSSVDTNTRLTARMSLGKMNKSTAVVSIYSSDSEVDDEGNGDLALPPEKAVGGSVSESRQASVASTECRGNVGAQMQAEDLQQMLNEKLEKMCAQVDAEISAGSGGEVFGGITRPATIAKEKQSRS